ncbi:putative gustatory receptor 28a [Augochlora pura]
MAYSFGWTCGGIISFHIIFKIIGLAPVSLHYRSSKTKRTISFKRSEFAIFYNVFLCIFLIASSFFTLPKLYNHRYHYNKNILNTIEIVQATYGIVMTTTVLLCYVYKWDTLKKICNYLMQIEGQFPFTREQVARNYRNLSLIYIFQTFICISVVVTEELAFSNGPLGWAIDALPTTFAANFLFQYFSMVSILKMNFVIVNEAFQGFDRNSTTNSKSVNRYRRVFVNSSMTHSLRHLRNIYDDLCDTTDEVSQFYSFSVLLVTFYVFYSLMFNIYYVMQPLFDTDVDIKFLPVINTIALLAYLVFPLFILNINVTMILNEFDRTGIIVNSLLKNTIDQKIKAELKQFSLLLVHRKIKFTASDYFSLDNTLIESMSRLLATYLVILGQFQMAIKS